jgi:hypothetical protein
MDFHTPWIAARGYFSAFVYGFIGLTLCLAFDGLRTTSPLVLWAAGAGLRRYLGDRQVLTDIVFYTFAKAWTLRGGLEYIVAGKWKRLEGWVVTGLLAYVVVVTLYVCFLMRAYFVAEEPREIAQTGEVPAGASPWTLPYPKAKIFPCEVKHARMFPKRHAFEYSYLQCGFPIIPAIVARDGKLFGDDSDIRLGKWWLRINAKDYLGQGNGWAGFYTKLKIYLREQVRCISVEYARTSDSSSTWTMPNGRMPT